MKPILHTDANKKQVAALTTMGMTPSAIAKELKLDKDTVERILKLPDTQAMIDNIGEDAIRAAKSRLRTRIASLADKIAAALEYQLVKNKSVQAAALGLKVMGMDQPVNESGNGNLTVYLPGAQKPEPVTLDAKGHIVKPDKSGK